MLPSQDLSLLDPVVTRAFLWAVQVIAVLASPLPPYLSLVQAARDTLHSLQHSSIPDLMLATAATLGRYAQGGSWGFSPLAVSWLQVRNRNVSAMPPCALVSFLCTPRQTDTEGAVMLCSKVHWSGWWGNWDYAAPILQHRQETLFSMAPFTLWSGSKLFWCSVCASLTWLELSGSICWFLPKNSHFLFMDVYNDSKFTFAPLYLKKSSLLFI